MTTSTCRWFSWGVASLLKARVGVHSLCSCTQNAGKKVQSLPLVPQDQRSCFQGKRSGYLGVNHLFDKFWPCSRPLSP